MTTTIFVVQILREFVSLNTEVVHLRFVRFLCEYRHMNYVNAGKISVICPEKNNLEEGGMGKEHEKPPYITINLTSRFKICLAIFYHYALQVNRISS